MLLCMMLQEVDDLFYKYGKISNIDIKPGLASGQSAYCFVEFGHPDDAYDAMKAMDGKEVFNKRLRVRAGQKYIASTSVLHSIGTLSWCGTWGNIALSAGLCSGWLSAGSCTWGWNTEQVRNDLCVYLTQVDVLLSCRLRSLVVEPAGVVVVVVAEEEGMAEDAMMITEVEAATETLVAMVVDMVAAAMAGTGGLRLSTGRAKLVSRALSSIQHDSWYIYLLTWPLWRINKISCSPCVAKLCVTARHYC